MTLEEKAIKTIKEIGNIAVFIIQMFMNIACIAFGAACIGVSLNSEQTVESGYLVVPMKINHIVILNDKFA